MDKLEINKLVRVTTVLNDLKTNIDDFDVDKMKTVLVDLKKLSDVVHKQVVKKTVYYKVNMKVNSLEKKI